MFLPSSREKYLQSDNALLDGHRQICVLPTLRSYRWLVNGLTSFNALQGAVALAACIMDRPGRVDTSRSNRVVLMMLLGGLKSSRSPAPFAQGQFHLARIYVKATAMSREGQC